MLRDPTIDTSRMAATRAIFHTAESSPLSESNRKTNKNQVAGVMLWILKCNTISSLPCSFITYGPWVVSRFLSSVTSSTTSGGLAGHILPCTANPSTSSYCGLSSLTIHWPWMYWGLPVNVNMSGVWYRGWQWNSFCRIHKFNQTAFYLPDWAVATAKRANNTRLRINMTAPPST